LVIEMGVLDGREEALALLLALGEWLVSYRMKRTKTEPEDTKHHVPVYPPQPRPGA